MDKKVFQFLGLMVLTIGVNYFTPEILSSLYYVILLAIYFRSKNEALWLAFFLVVSDGFFGFFGAYQSTIALIPGLPAIEIGNFYILLTIVKTWKKPKSRIPFYNFQLQLLALYLIFMYVQGYVIGVHGPLNIHFRVIKYILPFVAFFTIPRLFDHEHQYRDVFRYLFPVVILAFFAQIFTILMAQSPPQFFGIEETRQKILLNLEVTEERGYRGIYNESLLIIGLFGGLFYLSTKEKFFSTGYLYAVIISIGLSYLFSASRGYVLGYVLTLGMYVVLAAKISLSGLVRMTLLSVVVITAMLSVRVIRLQLDAAWRRLETLETLAAGDPTMGGTLSRLTERGPAVMKVWKESPLTGWGFSNTFFEKMDMHVGNQTLLLNGGIIGALVMGLFFLFFNIKMFFSSLNLPRDHLYKNAFMVFPILFIGWFIIHTTNQYYFSFFQVPRLILIQVIFFDFGDLIYKKVFKQQHVPEKTEKTTVGAIETISE